MQKNEISYLSYFFVLNDILFIVASFRSIVIVYSWLSVIKI